MYLICFVRLKLLHIVIVGERDEVTRNLKCPVSINFILYSLCSVLSQRPQWRMATCVFKKNSPICYVVDVAAGYIAHVGTVLVEGLVAECTLEPSAPMVRTGMDSIVDIHHFLCVCRTYACSCTMSLYLLGSSAKVIMELGVADEIARLDNPQLVCFSLFGNELAQLCSLRLTSIIPMLTLQ
jgi:hypothetical protein